MNECTTCVVTACIAMFALAQCQAQTCSLCQPAAPGIVNWWSGDFNGNDFAGAANGKLSGGVTFTPGQVNNAFTFDGTGQVDFGAAGQFLSSDFTIDFWLKAGSATNSLEAVMEKRTACANSSFWSIRLNTGVLAEINDGNGNDVQIQGSTNVQDGAVHHIAVVRQALTLSLYVDGNLDGSVSAAVKPKISNKAHFTAAFSVCDGVDGTVSFSGQLDEIQVFKSALSGTQIASIYNAGSAGNCK